MSNNLDSIQGFVPMLLRAEVATDMLNPGQWLTVTTWWQNIGQAPAASPLHGFMDLEIGHQRHIETDAEALHIDWSPQPGLQFWQPGEVHATTCRWKVASIWGGSFKVFIGFCNENRVPVKLIGADGMETPRVQVGQVEIGWGYGEVAMSLARKPIATQFNTPITYDAIPFSEHITLSSSDLTATLCKDVPVLRSLSSDEVTFNAPLLQPVVAFRDSRRDVHFYSTDAQYSVVYVVKKMEKDNVCYHATAGTTAIKIAEWDILVTLYDAQISFLLENVQEYDGFELLNITLPSMITVGEDGYLVDVFMGGRLIPVKEAPALGYVHPYDVRNTLGLFNEQGTVVLDAPGLDDKTIIAIHQNEKEKRGALGVILTHKIPAVGKDNPSLAVMNSPTVRLTVLDAAFGAPGWQAMARFLRKDLQPAPSFPWYNRRLVHKILVTWGPQPSAEHADTHPVWGKRAETHTFDEVRTHVARICNLIDGGPQACYVAGWQYIGYDTGYPYIDETDSRAGTVAELRQLIADAPRYNAIIGMHDNYDDAFPSPHFDPSIISIDEQGKMWKGWIWAGGMSYAISLKKGMELGKIPQRIDRTIELYGINTSYHLDVMSSEILKWDFDPKSRAAADEMMQSKIALVREFNKRGIDITSESMPHPLIGVISHAYSTRDNANTVLFDHEQYIPLVVMICHGVMRYIGERGDSKRELLTNLLRGAQGYWNEAFELQHDDIGAYYLNTLPTAFLDERPIMDMQQDGACWSISYGDNNTIKLDFSVETYEITVDGRVYGRNWTTFAPGFKQGSWLAYMQEGGSFCYPGPMGWADGSKILAVTLTEDGEGTTIPVVIQNGEINMELPARTPVRVTLG